MKIWNHTWTFQCRIDHIHLSNLFSSKFFISPSNDHINNLKDKGEFAEENKHYHSSESQDDTTDKYATGWSE